MRNRMIFGVLALAGLWGLCPSAAHAQDAVGGGSAFVNAVYRQLTELAKAKVGVNIVYDTNLGPTLGQNRLLSREIDFAAAGMPLSQDTLTSANILQFPVLVGAVATVVNIPGVQSGQLKLDGVVLAKIFTGAIKQWNAAEITALNPGVALPALDITPISLRDSGRGESYGFTQYLLAANADWQAKYGAAITRRWSVGTSVEAASDALEAIKLVSGGIAYLPYGTAEQNNLTMVALRNAAEKFVAPNAASIEAGVNGMDWNGAANLVVGVRNIAGEGAYPIMQTSYMQVPTDPKDMAHSVAVRKFVEFAFKDGSPILAALGFAPLPAGVQDKVRAVWSKIGS